MKQLKTKIYILLLLLLQLTYASGSEALLSTTKNTTEEFVLSIHKQHTVNKAGNKLSDLTIDILAKPQLLTKFVEKPELVEAWKIISHRRIDLRTNTDALEAISKIRANPKFADFGLDDNLLGQLKGWGYGVDNGASYAEIITDLDRLLNNCATNSTTFANFNKITDVFKNGTNSQKKGMHWIMQDLAADTETFVSKELHLEFSVPNARPNSYNSAIDVFCANCFTGNKRLLVEYKYGPTSITKQTIIKQFIERDLFNPDITSINQIQWRLKETGLTKSQLNAWLNTTECRTAIKNLGKQKIALLLDDTSILNLTKTEAADRLINHLNIETNYNLIFR